MTQLAIEFGVTRRTIFNDIQILSCSFTITTRTDGVAGVYIDKVYRFGTKYLTAKQESLLEKLAESLIGEDLITMMTVIKTFSHPV